MAVGGDVFDVYRLSENRALVLIADISGKGVDAAVLTAFIKFMIRAIALRKSDPAAILAEFNVGVLQGRRKSVSLRFDVRRRARHRARFDLEYGSAGHDCAYVRRDAGVAPACR